MFKFLNKELFSFNLYTVCKKALITLIINAVIILLLQKIGYVKIIVDKESEIASDVYKVCINDKIKKEKLEGIDKTLLALEACDFTDAILSQYNK